MAKQSFKFFTPREKPKKRGPRQHKKNKNKSRKTVKKNRLDTKDRVDKLKSFRLLFLSYI